MRIDLVCDLDGVDDRGHIVAMCRHASRPDQLRVGAVVTAGDRHVWSWVLIKEIAGELVFAEMLNGPFRAPGVEPPHQFDAAAVAAIEERFFALSARFHPTDASLILMLSRHLAPDGVAVLHDPDNLETYVTNNQLRQRGDDIALWELCRRLVDTATASSAH